MAAFDPDLDVASRPRPAGSGDLSEHQRLVVNPLLAVLALLGDWALLVHSLAARNVYLFLATLFATVVSLLLIQYHCLDCGRTDFVLRARRHACPAVVHRQAADEEPPLLPPSVKAQVKAWGLAFAAALVLLAIYRAHG